MGMIVKEIQQKYSPNNKIKWKKEGKKERRRKKRKQIKTAQKDSQSN